MRQVMGLVSKLGPKRDFGQYEVLESAGVVSPRAIVPAGSVNMPKYAESGVVPPSLEPTVNSKANIEQLRLAGRTVKKMLDHASTLVQVGTTTDEIDAKMHAFMLQHDVYPSPLNYMGFPKSICTSVNNVSCHGIPDSRPLANGDIVNVDITVFTRAGFHGDSSRTFKVGNVDSKGRELVQVAHDAMMVGIEACGPGLPVNVIGEAIESYITLRGFSTNRTFCGHGLNRDFHAPPLIRHTRNQDRTKMVPGMVFTVEPIINQGTNATRTWIDTWTVVTADGARTAQFEHMVLITDKGYEVLTA